MEFDFEFEWSKEQTLRFIELVKETPVIWNFKHKDHYNKAQRQEGWEKVSLQMRVPARDLKKKWESLQASFRREKKKSIGDGIAIDPDEEWLLESKWFAYDALSFLLQNNRRKLPITTESIPSIQDTSKIVCSTPIPSRRKMIKTEEEKPPDDDCVILKTPTCSSDDEAQMFGNLVAMKLRNSDPRRRSYIQLQIMQLFHSEEQKFIHRPMIKQSFKKLQSPSHSAARVYNDHNYDVVTECVIPPTAGELQEVYTDKI